MISQVELQNMSIYDYNTYVANNYVLDIDLWDSKLNGISEAQAQADLYRKIQNEKNMSYDLESNTLTLNHKVWASRTLNIVKLIIVDETDNADFNYIAALKKSIRALILLPDYSTTLDRPWAQGRNRYNPPRSIIPLMTTVKLDWPCAGMNPINCDSNSLKRVCKAPLAPLGVTVVYSSLPTERQNTAHIRNNWHLVEKLQDKVAAMGGIKLHYDCSCLRVILSGKWPMKLPANSENLEVGQWATLYGATPGQVTIELTQNCKKQLNELLERNLELKPVSSTLRHIGLENFRFIPQAVRNQQLINSLVVEQQEVLARDD